MTVGDFNTPFSVTARIRTEKIQQGYGKTKHKSAGSERHLMENPT